MNTIEALAELQERYNKLADYLIRHRTEINAVCSEHESAVTEYELRFRKGVISDTEFAEAVLNSARCRDKTLAQLAIQFSLA